MVQVNYTEDAFTSLINLVNYIESKNTQGAGIRWFRRYESFINNKLLFHKQIALCNNSTFHQLNLHCLYFNDWVIAFSIEEDTITIEALLHKSRIVN